MLTYIHQLFRGIPQQESHPTGGSPMHEQWKGERTYAEAWQSHTDPPRHPARLSVVADPRTQGLG